MDPRLVDYLASLGASPDALDGWQVHAAQRAGVDVGFVIIRGPEFHILSTAPGRAMTRKNILAFVKPVFEEHGYITTRVPLAETDHRLRQALGFTRSWDDEQYSYWAMTALPYERHKPEGTPSCQSL